MNSPPTFDMPKEPPVDTGPIDIGPSDLGKKQEKLPARPDDALGNALIGEPGKTPSAPADKGKTDANKKSTDKKKTDAQPKKP
jgi:hypothetical protein